MACNCDDPGVSEINANESCAETQNCTPVVSTSAIVAGGCGCGCSPCQCEMQRGTGSTPFYNQAPTCQESHTKVLNQYTFVTAVETSMAFNMPACNASVTVYLPGVIKLQVGGYLWNATYGYLKVVAYDFTTFMATLMNECQLSNAAPGTPIPACTQFNVVDPPYEPVSGGCEGDGIFLTANFTAPALNASVTIQVTGIAGLLVNNYVQVGTGVYLLTVIVTPTSITIKNTGTGHIPGTTVSALNALGDCITPITPYSEDPCAATAATPGALVVCVDGALTTLDAYAVGQVPVVVDADTNEVEFQTIDAPSVECTTLEACLNLIAGTDDYTIHVADNDIFYVGQLVVIRDPNIDDMFWVITAINDVAGHEYLDITAVDPNTYTGAIPEGTEVCEAFCCDQLDYELNHLGDKICDQDWSDAFANDYDLSYEAPEGGTINAGDPDFTASTRTLEFTNDTCNQMIVMCHVEYLVQGTFDASEMSWARVALKPYIGHTTAAIPGPPVAPVPTILKTLTDERTFGMGGGAACNAYNSNYFIQYHHTEIFTVPANTMLRIDAYQKFGYSHWEPGTDACCACEALGEPGTGEFTIVGSTVYMHAVGIAVQEA